MTATDAVQLEPGQGVDIDLAREPELASLIQKERERAPFRQIAQRGGGEDWDAPFDLRVMRPRAVDLRKLWQLTGQPVPPNIAAALGPRIPILLSHVVTPFPKDGRFPARVWALGYEFVADIDADTVSVVPNDEVFELGSVGQSVDFGLDLGGAIGAPDGSLGKTIDAASVSLTNATIRASTSQKFHFAVALKVTLRKVVGAPVGVGGAQWKMFRQDEPLDQPHTLLQTLLVKEGTRSIRCTVKTWATQAGWLGTRFGARYWPYEDQEFVVSLAGL